MKRFLRNTLHPMDLMGFALPAAGIFTAKLFIPIKKDMAQWGDKVHRAGIPI